MRLSLPHTFSVIFILITLMAVLSWFLPTGSYDRVYNEELGRELVVAGSYKQVDKNPQGYIGVFSSFSKGFVDAAEIISFVLIVGGAYGVIMKTGALDSAFKQVIKKLGGKALLLIPLLMILFAIAGTVQGFWEETLPFYLIVIPLMVRLGYDSVVGLAVVLIGSITGVLASTVNPFATGIASAIAETNIAEGFGTRAIMWVIMVSISIMYVLYYAKRVKKDHNNSVVADLYNDHRDYFLSLSNSKNDDFSSSNKIITFSFVGMILFMMYAISQLDWWIAEITMMFLSLSVLSAIVTKMKEKDMWDSFIEGANSFMYAALVIALARAIVIVAQDGLIMDTILYGITSILEGLPKSVFLVLNQFVQTLIAMLVPSTSGHASLTMPIMAPLADLLFIERSTIITSFQVGSGLANMITPTAGVLMAALGIARVPYGSWLRFVIPLVIVQFVVAAIITLIF